MLGSWRRVGHCLHTNTPTRQVVPIKRRQKKTPKKQAGKHQQTQKMPSAEESLMAKVQGGILKNKNHDDDTGLDCQRLVCDRAN